MADTRADLGIVCRFPAFGTVTATSYNSGYLCFPTDSLHLGIPSHSESSISVLPRQELVSLVPSLSAAIKTNLSLVQLAYIIYPFLVTYTLLGSFNYN
jgi:hypothetical protein